MAPSQRGGKPHLRIAPFAMTGRSGVDASLRIQATDAGWMSSYEVLETL